MSNPERPRGECPLTPAELRAVELLMDGLSYEEIAEHLGRATSTIRSQLHSAYHRLGVTTSYQAVLECVRAGWLTWSQVDPETATLSRVEDLLRRLIDAVESRRDPDALTDAQRRYLDGLDAHLRARTDEQRHLSRARVDSALAAMLRDANVTMPRRPSPRDLVHELGSVVDAHAEPLAA